MTVENADKHLDGQAPESGMPRKPLSIRLLHWTLAALFIVAYATAYRAFDFETGMLIKIRDGLFAAHRLCGLIAGLLLIAWLFIRLKSIFRSIVTAGSFRIFGVFHIVLGLACFILPVLPWIARSRDGRLAELYSLWPTYNLVSHPTTDLVYQLLHYHKQLADIVLILLGLHIAGALFHHFVLKDRTLWAMWFGRR